MCGPLGLFLGGISLLLLVINFFRDVFWFMCLHISPNQSYTPILTLVWYHIIYAVGRFHPNKNIPLNPLFVQSKYPWYSHFFANETSKFHLAITIIVNSHVSCEWNQWIPWKLPLYNIITINPSYPLVNKHSYWKWPSRNSWFTQL